MSLGPGVFIACLVLGAVLAAFDCRRTWHWRGRGWAIGEAVVMSASLGTFAGVCIWLGYSLPAQVAAVVLSGVPLLLGFKFVPPFNVPREGGHR